MAASIMKLSGRVSRAPAATVTGQKPRGRVSRRTRVAKHRIVCHRGPQILPQLHELADRLIPEAVALKIASP